MRRMIPVLLALLLLAGCGGGEREASYQQISQEEAKEMMDTQEVIILDVREQDEYDSGHIPDSAASGDHRRGRRSRGDPGERFDGPGVLPQRKPQQDGLLHPGGAGVYQHLRIRRHQDLALRDGGVKRRQGRRPMSNRMFRLFEKYKVVFLRQLPMETIAQLVKGSEIRPVFDFMFRHPAHHLPPGHLALSAFLDDLATFPLAEGAGDKADTPG